MTKSSEYLLPDSEKVTPGATETSGMDYEALATAALRGDFKENAVAPIDVLSEYKVGGPVHVWRRGEDLCGVVIAYPTAKFVDLESLWAAAAEEYEAGLNS